MSEIVWDYSSLISGAIGLSIIWLFDHRFTSKNFGREFAGPDRRQKEAIVMQHLGLRKFLFAIFIAVWYFEPPWMLGPFQEMPFWAATAATFALTTTFFSLRMSGRPIHIEWKHLGNETFGYDFTVISWIWRDIVAILFLTIAFYGPVWLELST